MTTNGIEVDDTPEDESRDLIAEAGRLARGEDGSQPTEYLCAACVRALVDEVGGALLMAHDTLRDMEKVNRAIQRVEMAEACRIAKEHAAGVLARLESSK